MKTRNLFLIINILLILLIFIVNTAVNTSAQSDTVECLDDCECLTEKEANEKFNENYEKCSDDVCGYDESVNIIKINNNAFSGNFAGYSFKIDHAVYSENVAVGIIINIKRPDGTEVQVGVTKTKNNVVDNLEIELLNIETAGEFITAEIKVYDHSAEPQDKYCFMEKVLLPDCPDGCECLTENKAKEKGYEYDYCQEKKIVCGEDKYRNLKYCFEKLPLQVCPDGCECLTAEDAKKSGYVRCNDNKILCGSVRYGHGDEIPKYCYETPAPTPKKCPDECKCMTVENAERLGYVLCKDKKILCGHDQYENPMYCYEKLVPTPEKCPDECECLTKEEGYSKDLYFCLNKSDSPIACMIDAGHGIYNYCFYIKPEEIPTPECPPSCDDKDNCTRDYCSNETNYTCKYEPIVPCCGNGKCEDEETCLICPEDCGKCKFSINCGPKNATIEDTVECYVSDDKGDAVSGVKFVIPIKEGELMEGELTKVTDENGRIAFVSQHPGMMEVTAEKEGYATEHTEVYVGEAKKSPIEQIKQFFDWMYAKKWWWMFLMMALILLFYVLHRMKKKGKEKEVDESPKACTTAGIPTKKKGKSTTAGIPTKKTK